jgi:aminopeptidase N
MGWALAVCWAPGVFGQVVPTEPDPIVAGRAAPPGTYGDLDVLHYDVAIVLPPPGGTAIEGRAILTLRPLRRGLRRVALDLTGLAVMEATVDGQVTEATVDDGRVWVPLPIQAAPDRKVEVVLRYRGTPDDGLILRNNIHGRPAAFVDNWPNRTRFWLPSVDHPSDKATATLTVHAPAEWKVVSNGILEGEPTPSQALPGGRVWRWATDVAVSPYNLVFGAADMVVQTVGLAACGLAPASSRPDGCVEVTTWLFEEDVGQADLSFRRADDMVDFYARLVGPFPFEKLAHVQSATRFGGMENASAIFYSEEGLASGRDMEGTVAHETAHQWFGDHVTEADWPELWLSEGFATYFGHLYFESADGEEAFRRRMEDSRRDYLASEVTGRPVIDRGEQDLFALLNPNNYPKGGWVLHMLRGILGDEAFFRGIREYYAGFGGSVATSADFRDVMEDASGMELDWFFRQWLEEPGYPVLGLEHRWDEEAGEAVVTVVQGQDPDWPAFRLPMEIEVVLDDGTRERRRIEVRRRRDTFRFRLAAPPAAVRLDPGGWVLKG